MNEKCSTSSQDQITSKYFTSKCGMDESLSDFQEPKKNIAGPKNTVKLSKSKPRKPAKRIKGQKDIRTALNKNKNELQAYSVKFDAACKHNGIDVDSEQLQLAIALSKSLQQEELASGSPKHKLSTQEKIRTTLQEYGFSVPKAKITSKTKKAKKLKKDYKLLQITEAERHQIVSDKLSQVLFENPITSFSSDPKDTNEAFIYNITTNSTYDTLRDDNFFYVIDNLEKAPFIGSLLKNWAEIPGRPSSPILKPCKMNFSEIECSQDDLDVILSGSLKCAKNVLKSKWKQNVIESESIHEQLDDKITKTTSDSDNNVEGSNKGILGDIQIVRAPVDTLTKSDIMTQYRSCSPDLFDDELSIFTEITQTNILSQDKDITTPAVVSIMDLTECVNIKSVTTEKPSSQLSQNVTKRRSNDFMEMTECVASTSTNILVNAEIDLTQSPENNDQTIKVNDKVYTIEMPVKHLTDNLIPIDEENIDLTQNLHDNTNDKNTDNMDLTQSSNSSIDLPFVQLSSENRKDLDKTVVIDINDYVNLTENKISKYTEKEVILDLTEETNYDKCTEKSKNGSMMDDFIYEHSDSIEVKNDSSVNDQVDGIDLTQSSNSSTEMTNRDIVDTDIESAKSIVNLGKIDNVSIDYDDVLHTSYIPIVDKSLQDNGTENLGLINESSKTLNKSADLVEPDNNLQSSNYSQTSEVFEILDNELDYSLHQSRIDVCKYNFMFGGISVLDELSDASRFSSKSVPNTSDFGNKSILPELNVNLNDKNSVKTPHKDKPHTSDEEMGNKVLKTPGNGEYIMKTSEVTPIMDYASMSTPEVNKELNKYGLKPFKRKRAIQLLTHLYHQTHPLVECCDTENMQSPSKKARIENSQPSSSSNRLKSPRNESTSPKKATSERQTSPKKRLQFSKNVLEISPIKETITRKSTNSRLDFGTEYKANSDIILKEVRCNPEDWVFQKREKAKVHSCRVPLHIAFFNYVNSCRELKESILRYEPINIDVIHKMLVSFGHRYDPKDLLRFLDKKCITVKTADNDVRNKR